jgi:hypothetical protein
MNNGNENGVEHSKWSNVVERSLHTTTEEITSSASDNTMVKMISTTSATTTRESTTLQLAYTGPTTYVPMWTPPLSAQPPGGQGTLKASLQFLAPTTDAAGYAAADAAASLQDATAAMIGVKSKQILLLSISTARELSSADSVPAQGPRRLATNSALRVDYLVSCASETERSVVLGKLKGVADDLSAQSTFTETLAKELKGRLAPVDPSSVGVTHVGAWHPFESNKSQKEGVVVDIGNADALKANREKHTLLWVTVAAILVLCTIAVLLVARPWQGVAGTKRGVKLAEEAKLFAEEGALPPGAIGFSPGHFAELAEAARSATMHVSNAGWMHRGYQPVNTGSSGSSLGLGTKIPVSSDLQH